MNITFRDGRYWLDDERPLCAKCNRNITDKRHSRAKEHKGKRVVVGYRLHCSTCVRGYSSRKADKVREWKMTTGCQECGFKPVEPCQIDIDHINGDHDDNSPDNLKLLCANCHRLKTYRNREGNLTTRALDKAIADAIEQYMQR